MLPREDKLADTAPKQPLALTLGAAAVTIAVILGVLAGPSVVTCFNSSDGMGQCLRGKMVGAGILPTPATAVAEQPAAAPTEEVAVVTPPAETAVGEPALDVTPPADVPENLIAATFGLLRAEPDGSVVIAGSGTPGSEVEIYSNDTLLGKTTVESSGDWVFVPDAPIPPGGTEITLGEAGKTGRSEQSFVVAINEDKTSEPLVVASTPGAASEVLQGLDTPSAEPTQLAAADPVIPPAEPAPTEPAPPAEPAAPVEVAPADVTTAEAPATEAPAPETPAAPVEQAAAEPTPPVAATVEAEPAEVAAPAELATPTEPAAPAEAQTAVAVAEPVPATPVPVVADSTPPTIDAIEIEGDRTFFAGAGPEGAVTRLYVDDQFIAETKVADGRWLVEAGKVLNNPSQRIRIDVLQPDSAKVASRAEVNFVVELPAEAAPVAVAQADEPVAAPAQPAARPVDPASAEPTAAPEPAAEAVPAVETPTVPAEPAQPAEPAPAVEPAQPAEVAAATEPAPVTETAPAVEPAPTVEPAPATEPAAAAEPAPAAETPAPVASDIPTLVAVSVGDPEAARFASGKAIIRRGDNLWTIARRVYGEGIKYTTIYQANTGQIRDPDRIYPGQVFDLPEGSQLAN